jgi:hypothetical protein
LGYTGKAAESAFIFSVLQDQLGRLFVRQFLPQNSFFLLALWRDAQSLGVRVALRPLVILPVWKRRGQSPCKWPAWLRFRISRMGSDK